MNVKIERKMRITSMMCLGMVLLSSFFFSACKNSKAHEEKTEQKVEVPKDDIEFQKKISAVLEEYIPELPSDVSDSTRYMGWHEVAKTAYKQNNYTPFWVSRNVLSAKGREMLLFVGSAEFLGLNKDLYNFEKLHQIADSLTKLQPNVDFNLSRQLEVGLTRAFFQIALHVDHGMFADTIRGINSNFLNSADKYIGLLNKPSTDSISGIISSLEPDNPMYNRYMKALRAFVSKNNISSTPITIRNPKLDSLGAVDDTRKALVYHHYLADSLRDSNLAYLKALKKFQQDNNLNGDGAIGANTIKALERDNSKKFQLLAINADRWRKEHIVSLPDKYVWVNLPSYRVRIIEKDTVRLEKRVVIGKATERTESPVLQSAINQIILWPTWTVPQYIIKHEMKSFKGFVVTQNNGWTSVVQPPGLKNALGSVKILFPNKYSVYMHDTPAKSLFNSDLRAASHGCVRCQDALEIAANLMMMDTFQITYDSLKALRDEKIMTQTFRLKKPIPVYFRYFTAEPDFKGNINFYADVYQRDKDMIDYIFNSKKPHVATKKEREYADSVAAVKKKKNDSITAEAKLKAKKDLLSSGTLVKNYSPKLDTTSAKHDSL